MLRTLPVFIVAASFSCGTYAEVERKHYYQFNSEVVEAITDSDPQTAELDRVNQLPATAAGEPQVDLMTAPKNYSIHLQTAAAEKFNPSIDDLNALPATAAGEAEASNTALFHGKKPYFVTKRSPLM